MFNSGLFIGTIRHRRFLPIKHDFRYDFFMPLLDLDEISKLEQETKGFSLKKWALASFYFADYFDGRQNVKEAALDKIFELTGEKISGKVLALCQLRYFGFYFSPVNFYYIYDENENWRYLLAEVSNTPWNERHYYAVPAKQDWQHQKAFHVSPFNPINQRYNWKLRPLSNKVFIHLAVDSNNSEFDATLALSKHKFESKKLNTLLLKTPIMGLKMLVSIYWQALKLWLKGANFYSHPQN